MFRSVLISVIGGFISHCLSLPAAPESLGSCRHFIHDSAPQFPLNSENLRICKRGWNNLEATVVPGTPNFSLIAGEPVFDSCCSLKMEEEFMSSAKDQFTSLISEVNTPLLELLEAHNLNLSDGINKLLMVTEAKMLTKLSRIYPDPEWHVLVQEKVAELMHTLHTLLISRTELDSAVVEQKITLAVKNIINSLVPQHFICFLGYSAYRKGGMHEVYMSCLMNVTENDVTVGQRVQHIVEDTVAAVNNIVTALHSVRHLLDLVRHISHPKMWQNAQSCFEEYSRMHFCSMCVPDVVTVGKGSNLCPDYCTHTMHTCLQKTLGYNFMRMWHETLRKVQAFAAAPIHNRKSPHQVVYEIVDGMHDLIDGNAAENVRAFSTEAHTQCGGIPKTLPKLNTTTKYTKKGDKTRGLRQTPSGDLVIPDVWKIYMDIGETLLGLLSWWSQIPRAVCPSQSTDVSVCWNGTHFGSYVRTAAGVLVGEDSGPQGLQTPVKDGQTIDIETKLANLQKTLVRNKGDSSVSNHGLSQQESYPDLQTPDWIQGSGDGSNSDTHFWYPSDDEDSDLGSGSGGGIEEEQVVMQKITPQFNHKLKPLLPNQNVDGGKFQTSETHPDDDSRRTSASSKCCGDLSFMCSMLCLLSFWMVR